MLKAKPIKFMRLPVPPRFTAGFNPRFIPSEGTTTCRGSIYDTHYEYSEPRIIRNSHPIRTIARVKVVWAGLGSKSLGNFGPVAIGVHRPDVKGVFRVLQARHHMAIFIVFPGGTVGNILPLIIGRSAFFIANLVLGDGTASVTPYRPRQGDLPISRGRCRKTGGGIRGRCP